MKLRRGSLGVLISLVALLVTASGAGAATTLGSPLNSPAATGTTCGSLTSTNTKLTAGALLAPFDGVIVRWRLEISVGGGSFGYKLRVLRPAGNKYVGAGTGPAQLAPMAGLNTLTLPTPLPIESGDIIGVDCPEGAPAPVTNSPLAGSTYAFFSPPLADGATGTPTNQLPSEEDLINADIVGAPAIGTVAPAIGSSKGGTTVTITGSRLGDLSGVTFGGVPASNLSVVSESEARVSAPAHAAGAVDVSVANLAGTSVAAGSFTYQEAPALSGLSESRKIWRLGSKPATVSEAAAHKAPVGTTFSFTLNAAANVGLAFSEKVGGRKVKGRCVGQTSKNAGQPACKRRIARGTLSIAGKRGANQVSFQGRVSKSRKLKPGRYLVAVGAANAGGSARASKSLSFEIVK